VLPNGDVYTGAVLVRSAYSNRRVSVTVGIGYKNSIERARSVIYNVLKKTEGVLHDPGPWVYVAELAPSSINFTVFFWTHSRQANVLMLTDRVISGIKLGLDEAGIDIPYPHSVVLQENTQNQPAMEDRR
jgi:small-conductance mechanosensitive channel